MRDPGEIARVRDRCSVFMGELLDELARTPACHFLGARESASARWEIWMDAGQAEALLQAEEP